MYARVKLPSYLRQISFPASIPFIQDLINANKSHIAVVKDGNLFHNSEIANLSMSSYTSSRLSELSSLLTEHNVITPSFLSAHTVHLSEGEQPLLLMPATRPDTSHGDMSNMLYLKDQVQTAELFLKLHTLNPQTYKQEGEMGKRLLLSALHLMSTPSQLARLQTCIAHCAAGEKCEQEDWPQITFTYDNLDGNRVNDWRNIQDTLQMLAYATLVALEHAQLRPEDLLASNKQFLGGVVPLIVSVGFPLYENSGTWEEVAARRTSVMAVETAFFSKLFDLRIGPHRRNYAFFAREYQKQRRHYPQLLAADFDELLAACVQKGLLAISSRLPFESPNYERQSVKYRTGDSNLVYVLRYHIPELLIRFGISVSNIGDPLAGHAREEQIEDLVLAQLDTLRDPQGYGMFRYRDDSYQRVNWETEAVQTVVKDIKRFVAKKAAASDLPIDYELKQSLRHKLTPQGRQAAWSLGSAHLAVWAAERFLEQQKVNTGRAARYNHIATRNLNQTLALVTGEGQFTSELSSDGSCQIQAVSSWQIPECYVTYNVDKQNCIVPSAHTPLYWTSSLIKAALGHMNAAIILSENTTDS